MKRMKIGFGLNDTLGIIRDTIALRIKASGEDRQVAVLATKRLLIVWDRQR